MFEIHRTSELTKIVSVKNRSQGGEYAHEELDSDLEKLYLRSEETDLVDFWRKHHSDRCLSERFGSKRSGVAIALSREPATSYTNTPGLPITRE